MVTVEPGWAAVQQRDGGWTGQGCWAVASAVSCLTSTGDIAVAIIARHRLNRAYRVPVLLGP